MQGRKKWIGREMDAREMMVEVGEISAGVYFLMVKDEAGRMLTKKFVVQN